MTILKGHFDGERIVLDDPVPGSVAPNTPVQVVFGRATQNADDGSALLAELADLAVATDDLPLDYGEQHD